MMHMRMKPATVIASALAMFTSTLAQARVPDSYGPAPEWGRYKQLGEAAVRAKLTEPDRWTIEWPYGYMQGWWRHKGRFVGYMTCGRLRTETASNGVAVVQFLTVIDQDMVKVVDISTRERNSLVNIWCQRMSSRALPPVERMEATAERSIARLGLSVRPTGEGAYITSVASDGAARRAGLAPGMVLISANGVKLAGMGVAIAALLESETSEWRLETAAGKTLLLRPAP